MKITLRRTASKHIEAFPFHKITKFLGLKCLVMQAAAVPAGRRSVFEWRDPSWFEGPDFDEMTAILRANNWCLAAGRSAPAITP